jgi:hypothetical protein
MSMLAESAKRNGRPEAAVNWWRRRDSRFRLFRGGLDYAFILLPGCGACYPLARILVRARRLPARLVYESLRGRHEVGPLPTPRRCHATSRWRQGSPM